MQTSYSNESTIDQLKTLLIIQPLACYLFLIIHGFKINKEQRITNIA